MKDLKNILKSEIAQNLMTNVLKIALNMNEDKIAGIIVAQYHVIIEESMINFAIASQSFHFI